MTLPTQLYLFLLLATLVSSDFAILRTEHQKYCVGYNPLWTPLPSSPPSFISPLVKVLPSLACQNLINPNSLNGGIAIVDRGNCTFYEKACFVSTTNATAMIIINNSSEIFSPQAVNQDPTIVIPVVIMSEGDAIRMFSGNESEGVLYAPHYYRIDPNALIILIISALLIAVGSHWSIYSPISVELTPQPSEEEPESLPFFVLNFKVVIFYIVGASVLLVVLYFLYQYAVYFIMGVFVLGSTSGTYMCLSFLLHFFKRIPEGPSYQIPYCGLCTVKEGILLVISFGLPIIWIILRHQSHIWILQNLLASLMILGVFRTIRLPSFKIAVILLSLFFIYDIFFVFITPLFTKDGKSIMVKVATGGDSQNEVMPLTIMLPHLVDVFEGVCGEAGYSLLGFGDVLMPGLLISFLLAFDDAQGTWKKKLYFLVSLSSYIIGLILTYIALLLMDTAQPALVYLVPCTLGSTALLGWKRGELNLLWTGMAEIPVDKNKEENIPEQFSNTTETYPLINVVQTSKEEEKE